MKKLSSVFKSSLSPALTVRIFALLLLLIGIYIVLTIFQFAQGIIKNETVEVDWQQTSNIVIARNDLSSCENGSAKTAFHWKGDLYEGTNCKLAFDEKYEGQVQYQDFKLYKNKKLVLSTEYYTGFNFFDCGDNLCIFVIAPVGDSIWDYVGWGTEPPKGKLSVILWPSKKTLVFSNPCRQQNQRFISIVNSFDVKQVFTKKFFVNIACSTLNFGDVSSYYSGEIEI